MARLGRKPEARRLANDELELAQAQGSAPAIGVALRCVGLAAARGQRLDKLHSSVDVLRPSSARLEYASSLVHLGAELRRGNLRADARVPLREGLDLAIRCGALPLARTARQELAATGARPRRMYLRGVHALTPSEGRVARMAADGLGNTDIAQALFVTKKTVEKHLGNVYMKLDITNRKELPQALSSPRENHATLPKADG